MINIDTQKQTHPPAMPVDIRSTSNRNQRQTDLTRGRNKSEEKFPKKRNEMDHVIFTSRR